MTVDLRDFLFSVSLSRQIGAYFQSRLACLAFAFLRHIQNLNRPQTWDAFRNFAQISPSYLRQLSQTSNFAVHSGFCSQNVSRWNHSLCYREFNFILQPCRASATRQSCELRQNSANTYRSGLRTWNPRSRPSLRIRTVCQLNVGFR